MTTYTKRTFGALFTSFVIFCTFAIAAPAHAQNISSSLPAVSTIQCPTIPQNLFIGLRDVYSGGDVYHLQQFLTNRGYLAGDAATGYFGRLTRAALAQYQRDNGIYPITGGLGPITRAHIASRCGTVPPTGIECPALPLSYPVCPNGATPEKRTDYRGCVIGFHCSGSTGEYTPPASCQAWNDGCNTCSRQSPGSPAACTLMACTTLRAGYCTSYFNGTGVGGTPTISSFSGPVTLAVGQQGTWSIAASDPYNQQLTYTITWGDEGANLYSLAAPSYLSSIYTQNTTYTHVYATPGTYTARITVRNPSGQTATSTASVVVGSGYGTSNLRMIEPNTARTYTTGTTTNISWQDTNTYLTSPRYDVYLRSAPPLCTGGYACVLGYSDYSYTIASGTYGTSYSWQIPSSTPQGSYVVEVCSQAGTSTAGSCDRSDTPFTLIQGTTNANFTSVNVTPLTVVRGGTVTTSWATSGAPADSRVSLELVNASTGVSFGYIALGQATSGSHTWTVPLYTTAVIADSPYVYGNAALDGKSVYVRARLYTPSDACFGYCPPGRQPTTLTTYNSNSFSIGTGISGTPTLSVSATGNRSVTVTTTTPTTGTTCGINGTLVLDYGDGTALPLVTTYSGSGACTTESRTLTYQYATTGAKTVTIRNNTYPYQIYTTQNVVAQ